jgi:response regulator of citrate/malate metabolism
LLPKKVLRKMVQQQLDKPLTIAAEVIAGEERPGGLSSLTFQQFRHLIKQRSTAQN